MKTQVFIGSSGESLAVGRAIQEELVPEFRARVWDQGVFGLSSGPLDSLLDALDESDVGIFVLSADDLLESRAVTNKVARDNVLFELGMFMGRLGRSRTFMVQPGSVAAQMHLPSDLAGVTTARYDDLAFSGGDERGAVGAACNQIRRAVRMAAARPPVESRSRKRLDEAMRFLSRDLQTLLSNSPDPAEGVQGETASELLSVPVGRARLTVELGRIQDYTQPGPGRVIALPANEYFDDECITDRTSSLGAFVQHHFGGDVGGVLADVASCLSAAPSERVSRAEQRIDDSYGIGYAICLKRTAGGSQVVLVSATTQRAGIGLRAEPHFLYAAIAGVLGLANEKRASSLVMPVFGSGHGGVPVDVALLFNILAMWRALADDGGRMLREVTIVVFDGDASYVRGQPIEDIRRHIGMVADQARH